MGKDLIQAVRMAIEKYRMLNRGDSVLVSVSGGPDSVFLMHALRKLMQEYNISLKVFHLDHLTRNGQSSTDASFVEKLCKREGLALRLYRVGAEQWSRKRGFSFQEGARVLRLKLLRDTARKEGITKIALGHHADDCLETFFLNLFRGSGISGLGAIKPVSGELIRPLIEIYSQDILAYLEQKNIDYCIDYTNLEHAYARNKVRNLLFPLLEKEFNPDFKKNILTLISIARQEDAYMSKIARSILDRKARVIYSEKTAVLLKLDLCFFQDIEPALKRRVIREAINIIKGDRRDITSKNIEQILDLARPGGESKKTMPGKGVLAVKEKDLLYFVNLDKKESLPAAYRAFFEEFKTEQELEPGKSTFSKYFNIRVQPDLREDVPRKEYLGASSMEAFLDYDKIKFPVKIRNWNKGDSFFPLGAGGEKKLQDFFTDLKIPRHKRSLVPVFEDREKIIWVAGYRIDERVKIGPGTSRVLNIKIFNLK